MNTVRKFTFATLVFLLGLAAPLTALRAEEGASSRKEPVRKAELASKMREELGLDKEQAEQIQKIMTAEREQLKGLRSDTSLSKEAKIAKMREIRDDTKAKVDALLTPEQKTKADEMRSKMQERRGEKGGIGEHKEKKNRDAE